MKTTKWIMLIVLLVSFPILGCQFVTQAINNTLSTPTVESNLPATPGTTQATLPAEALPTETQIAIPKGINGPGFAEYPQIAISFPVGFSGGYNLPLDLAGVKGLDALNLSDQQKSILGQNGFVVTAPIPGKYREFYQVYESVRYMDVPIFATTDAVFHIYHLTFDKMLRDLETDKFIGILQKLTETMLAASDSQYQQSKGTNLEEPARRNVAFFAIADQLLGLSDSFSLEAKDLVDSELALINAHAGAQISPIWDRPDLEKDKKLIEDYSQYVPRGHYTRSEELGRYFKVMMWYGRLSYRLRDAFETRRAILLVSAMKTAKSTDGTSAYQLWQMVYEPTVFIVGKADDLSVYEYGVLADLIFGKDAPIQAFTDDAKLKQFIDVARNLPAPQVNSMWVWIWEDRKEATQAFRFMGQRFTLDEYVFGQLIWRNVGTQDNPRGLPKSLDLFSALGSNDALNILDQLGETKYANFNHQMEKVRKEVAGLGLDSWTQNLYWSWLYSFQPLITPKDGRYPKFMQNQAWALKDMHTALGSWTELKHDTILYAKQVMAEMGGGGPTEPPHGYVEPNPEAYARLLALSKMTYDGLDRRSLLSDLTRGNLENLMSLLTFMQDIAQKELNGQALTNDEYWQIQYFGGKLEALTLAASDCGGGDQSNCRDLSDQKAAVIADVATGLAKDGSLVALEEGVGQPTEIYVVLPDQPYRVATGSVYTYYEFPVPVANRMTDEQWQANVQSGQIPAAPDWTKAFIAP